MRNMDEITEEIEELKNEKEELEEQENTEEYDEMLEETKDSWIKNYYGGTVLKEIDPIAYRCGLNDYNDGRLTEINDEINELINELKEVD